MSAPTSLAPTTWEKLATWGNGIHDLVYCFQRISGAAGSAYEGDNVGVGVNSGAALGKFAWYGRDKFSLFKAGSDNWKAATGRKLPTPTFVVDLTMVAISIVDMINGFVPPDSGTDFSRGADKFDTVYADLELAAPDPRDWSGTAADAYAAQNTALQERVQRMTELDQSMQHHVDLQGTQVQKAHLTITEILFGLIAAQGVALALYAIPQIGPDLSICWQAVTRLASITLAICVETETESRSRSHATAMDSIGDEYTAVATGTQLSSTFDQIVRPIAEEPAVGSFMNILDSTSGLPSIAALTSMAPRDAFVADDHALFGTLTGARETFPGMLTATAPSASALTMPTLVAPATTMSSQAAKPFELSHHYPNPFNQTPTARWSQEAAAATENIAKAGPGVSAGKRLPSTIATVGAEQTQEPSSLQPVL